MGNDYITPQSAKNNNIPSERLPVKKYISSKAELVEQNIIL